MMTEIITPDEYDLPRELSVSFTGHRPNKLPWGCDERDPRCAAFVEKLSREIRRAYSEGARYFLSGMADGVDTLAAEEVLRLSVFCPEIRLVAVLPYGTEARSARARRIVARAFRTVSVREDYCPGCYEIRNRFLVDHSVRLICGFGGNMASGTGQTVRKAMEEGVSTVIVHVY